MTQYLDIPQPTGDPDSIRYELGEDQDYRQQLYARIKRSSKYYGQGDKDQLFKVYVDAESPRGYVVQGGPGGQYRLIDVNIFIVDRGVEVRIA